jgi:hypothetical protein
MTWQPIFRHRLRRTEPARPTIQFGVSAFLDD